MPVPAVMPVYLPGTIEGPLLCGVEMNPLKFQVLCPETGVHARPKRIVNAVSTSSTPASRVTYVAVEEHNSSSNLRPETRGRQSRADPFSGKLHAPHLEERGRESHSLGDIATLQQHNKVGTCDNRKVYDAVLPCGIIGVQRCCA